MFAEISYQTAVNVPELKRIFEKNFADRGELGCFGECMEAG